MTPLSLSLACTQTDRAAPLLDGRVTIPGCRIVPLPGQSQDIFRRVLADRAFDIAEMSMSSHLIQVDRGVSDYTAIPVYLSRAFRHSAVYIRTDRGIDRPEDLAGRTVGVQQYQQTIGLWVRGMLGDEHGVRTQDVTWHNGGLEEPGGGERIRLRLPEAIRLTPIPSGETLNGMLADGRLDALIATKPPSCFVKGAPGVGRLWPDFKAAEIDYFQRTRFFPIMHCVVIRQELVDRHPWLPVEVFRAFARAKALTFSDLFQTNILRVSLPWIADTIAESRRLMGDNPWTYGLPDSRHEIEAMLRYARNDGLTDRLLTPEDVFHPSTTGLADTP
jgi:4,5-dihydroxyphthalate decarboxylase